MTSRVFQHSFQHSTKYVQVFAQETLCAIELQRVEKVIPLVAMHKVPNGPEYLAGIFDYQGLMVPVIDLALRIGELRDTDYDINSSILLCETMETDSILGIIAEVGDIFEIDYSELQLAPEFEDKLSPFLACYKQDSSVCYILNSDSLIDSSLSDFDALNPDDIMREIKRG